MNIDIFLNNINYFNNLQTICKLKNIQIIYKRYYIYNHKYCGQSYYNFNEFIKYIMNDTKCKIIIYDNINDICYDLYINNNFFNINPHGYLEDLMIFYNLLQKNIIDIEFCDNSKTLQIKRKNLKYDTKNLTLIINEILN